MDDFSPLFEPLTVRNVRMKNRFVMSPMTRFFSPNGVPGRDVAAYYRRRVEGGAGLIVTEGVGIPEDAAIDNPDIPLMYGQDALEAWRAVVAAVHEAGGVIFPQLWHMGPMLKRGVGPHPDATPRRPSGLWGPIGKNVVWNIEDEHLARSQEECSAMSRADIMAVIEAYADAARAAKQIGFDGIAVHGAHGYLPDAFLWSETNRRDDEYGGGIAERTLFVRQLIGTIRAAIGDEMPIMLRFSQWKQQDYKARLAATPQELHQLLKPISNAGVDIFDASTRRFDEPEFTGSDLNLAGWAQRITGKPTMTVGSIGLSKDLYDGMKQGVSDVADLSSLIDRFNRDEFALVGIGRAMLSNPDFVAKVRSGEPLSPFDAETLQTLA